LTRVQDPTGQRFLAFSYDDEGRLVEARDPISRTVRYGYDANNDLTTITDTTGVWTYIYTGTHWLEEVRDPAGRVVEHTGYDGLGRAVLQWGDAGGTAGSPLRIQYGSTTVLTDPLGGVTVDQYNDQGVLISQTVAGNSSARSYDAYFNWTATTDANGKETGYVFDPQGRPMVVTNALGGCTRLGYDSFGHLTVITNTLGRATGFAYTGNLLITTTDALNGQVVNTYDSRGLLVRVVDHGVTTTYGYDSLGQRTWETSPATSTMGWGGRWAWSIPTPAGRVP
jgi:YD repeat-containing protein